MEWIQLEISSQLSNYERSTIDQGMKYPLTHQMMNEKDEVKA